MLILSLHLDCKYKEHTFVVHLEM